jgi:hypothetical protein
MIILISLQGADHDHVYRCSRQGRHRGSQILELVMRDLRVMIGRRAPEDGEV